MSAASTLPGLLQAFFMDRLMQQRQASPHTVASYRDTFRLLLQYAQQRLGKAPSNLTVPELDTPLIGGFLAHLERDRGNSARSRNVRLAANPFILPLCGVARAGAQRRGAACVGHAEQALFALSDRLPDIR